MTADPCVSLRENRKVTTAWLVGLGRSPASSSPSTRVVLPAPLGASDRALPDAKPKRTVEPALPASGWASAGAWVDMTERGKFDALAPTLFLMATDTVIPTTRAGKPSRYLPVSVRDVRASSAPRKSRAARRHCKSIAQVPTLTRVFTVITKDLPSVA
jgi:hypothetical protein